MGDEKKKKKSGPKKKGNIDSPLLEKVLSTAILKVAEDAKVMLFEWQSTFKGKVIVSRARGNLLKAQTVQAIVNEILESKTPIFVTEKKMLPVPDQSRPLPPRPDGSTQSQSTPPVQLRASQLVEQVTTVSRSASDLKAVYIQRIQFSQWSPSKSSNEPRQYWEMSFLMGSAAVDIVKQKKSVLSKTKATSNKSGRRRKGKADKGGNASVASGTIGVSGDITAVGKKKRRRRRKKKKTPDSVETPKVEIKIKKGKKQVSQKSPTTKETPQPSPPPLSSQPAPPPSSR